MWVLFAFLLFAQNSTDSSSSSTDSTDSGTSSSGDSSGGPGVALFSSPTSAWKSQQNIALGQTLKVEWKYSSALTDGPEFMTLELEIPFTSPIAYKIIDDKIAKGATSYNWKVSRDLNPQKGYRLLLRRSQNDGEDRLKTLTAGFGQLTPSYSPKFTLYVSQNYSPDPATQAPSSILDWVSPMLVVLWL